jgi:glycerophosphoryl diester phosphodiesterase
VTRPRAEFAARNLVVAHRGASSTTPENTLPAFEEAARAGADVVELDVRLTRDGIPVVLHDPDVSATTDGAGPVHELTLAEVKRLDAGSGHPRVEVPTLEEALEAIDRGGIGVDLEVKNIPGEPAFDSPDEATLEAALRALDRVGFGGPVLVSSFNWITIEACRRVAPDLTTGFLTVAAVDPRAALDYARHQGHAFLLPHAVALVGAEEAFVREAHAEGIRVGTWTVDDEATLERLFAWNVDAVASNDPALAVAVRDRLAQ